MPRKRIYLSPTEEQFKQIEEAAANSNITIAAYCTALVLSSLNENPPYDSLTDRGYEHRNRRIPLTSDEAFTLREKASSLGLSDVAYLRKLIFTKDFNILDISSTDIDSYIAELHPLIDSINSFVSLIKRSDDNSIYKQDIDKLVGMLNEIKTLMKKQLSTSYSNRKKVYRDMMNKCKGGDCNGNS